MFHPKPSLAIATAAAVLAVPTAAHSATKSCANGARVMSGTVVNLFTIPLNAQNEPQPATAAHKRILTRNVYYYAVSAANVSMQKAHFHVRPGAVFGLSCWGAESRSTAPYPALDVDRGTVRATSTATRMPGITSTELLVDAQRGGPATFSLTRTPKGTPTLKELLAAGSGAGGEALLRYGTTVARRSGGARYVGLTPNVGKKVGLRRQGQGARATSTGRVNGRLVGTASFTGLSPFSPR